MTIAANAKNSAIDLPIIIPKGDQNLGAMHGNAPQSVDRLLVSELGTFNKSCMLNTPLTRYRSGMRLLCNFETSANAGGVRPRRAA